LIFVNRYFFPDHSATSQILSDLAFYLSGTDRSVHVITSKQIYDDPRASLADFEIIHEVRVHRVSASHFGRATLLGRLVDYVSFYRSAWRCLTGIVDEGDIVVTKTDPPLISLIAMAAARRRGARLIIWMQDVYPELAVKLGVPFIRGPVAMILAALRNRSLRYAEATVVVGRLMGDTVEALGAPAARVHVIPNWCNDEEIKPLEDADNPLRKVWELQKKFVIGYSGNLGRAHDFGTVLAAAEQLRDEAGILFLLIGGGKRFQDLARAVKERGLEHLFRFAPYQERKLLTYSLGAPDVHWISLNPALEGFIVPSKFYGIAAAGKPIIVIAANDGELSRLVRACACGVVIEPGDAAALVRTVLNLAGSPAACEEMGHRARKMLDADFTRQKAFERWDQLLDELEQSPALARSNRTAAPAAMAPG
jgi:colanic acid biosynthesis glycosyl transferase WcaI